MSKFPLFKNIVKSIWKQISLRPLWVANVQKDGLNLLESLLRQLFEMPGLSQPPPQIKD